MPRSMSKKYDEAFRIVVTVGGVVSYYGPYATAAAAKGQITGLRYQHGSGYRFRDERDATFEAWIEKSSASWERVE